MHKNQQIQVTIKRLGINGEGIGYFKKTILFIPGALPKEVVQVKVTEVFPNFAKGLLIKIIKPSHFRRTPKCAVYETCGGCQLQHLAYKQQLYFKKDLLRQALEKFKPTGYKNYNLLPTIGMDTPWHYRNKAQFQVRKGRDNHYISGLYQPNSHYLVDIEDCPIQPKIVSEIINFITKQSEKLNIPAYNERKNQGCLKTIMVRQSFYNQTCQLVLITHTADLPNKDQFVEQIIEQFPQIISIMQNVQPEKSSIVMGEDTIHLWGETSIKEKVAQVAFDLSAKAFFQLNPEQTQKLYAEVKRALGSTANQTIIDAYCGVGTIGLSLIEENTIIYGMDITPQAIADAKINGKNLDANTHYEVGPAEKWIPTWLSKGISPDALIVDPPRTGLDNKLIQTILSYPIPKLVYVSCNPSTLAKDLVQLTKGYHVDYCQSVDMFPQTARAEVVVSLTKLK